MTRLRLSLSTSSSLLIITWPKTVFSWCMGCRWKNSHQCLDIWNLPKAESSNFQFFKDSLCVGPEIFIILTSPEWVFPSSSFGLGTVVTLALTPANLPGKERILSIPAWRLCFYSASSLHSLSSTCSSRLTAPCRPPIPSLPSSPSHHLPEQPSPGPPTHRLYCRAR